MTVEISPRSFPSLSKGVSETEAVDILSERQATVGQFTLPVRQTLKDEDGNVRIVLGVEAAVFHANGLRQFTPDRAQAAALLQQAGFEGEYDAESDDRIKQVADEGPEDDEDWDDDEFEDE